MNTFTAFLLSFSLSIFFNRTLIYLSKKYGWIEDIKGDRWHKRSVAKFGGVAIFLSFILIVLLFSQPTDFIKLIVILSTLIFCVGFIDDIYDVSPSFKMLLFICIAIICFNYDIKIMKSFPIFISLPFTILWITGIVNAINIIDNMDGLCGGISSIALCFITYIAHIQNNETIFLISLSLLGASLGFLIFNFSPAKIFMGDSGSLFVGFILSIIALEVVGNKPNILATLFVPTLILAFPIFDTSLVSINRFLNKIPISQGGIDHTSHRLVSLGLSEKFAVLFLYSISILFGLIVIVFNNHGIRTWNLILLIIFLGFGISGLFLSYYGNSAPHYLKPQNSQNFFFRTIVTFKKQILEIIFDSLIVIFCFTSSYYLRYENNIKADIWLVHDDVIGWIVLIKITTFYLFNLYKGIWKYASIPDMINAFKATLSASISIIIFIFFIYGDLSFSRSIIVIDFFLTFIFVSSFRVFFRIFSSLFSHRPIRNSEKVLIIGAGDLCLFSLRKIFDNDFESTYLPVGILDNKPSLKGRVLLDVPIIGPVDDFQSVILKKNISLVLMTIEGENHTLIKKFCDEQNVKYKKVSIDI
jgi:UDP-GlcNAc:undecaprenyl-phosphate/decaprenyl-phosphate GlcNAc-1-phosphate transferase